MLTLMCFLVIRLCTSTVSQSHIDLACYQFDHNCSFLRVL